MHLIPYERPRKSEEPHLNQLFLLISCEFHVKSARFHNGFYEIQYNLQQDFMKFRDFKGLYEINRILLDYNTDFNLDFIMISL